MELQPIRSSVHKNTVTRFEASRKDLHRQWILKLTLNSTLQWAGAEIRVVTDIGKILACFGSDLQGISSISEQCLNPMQLDIDNFFEVFLIQRMENDNFVNSVELVGIFVI